jgi:hypothetical protein
MVSFDYGKLKGRIVEKYGSSSNFAKDFGVSVNTFSMKMNNKVRFTTDDITRICDMLDIPSNEIGDYFFTTLVSKN